MTSLFFGFVYYSVYWRYRALFDEQGRYFDEAASVVYHDDASIFIVPVLAFFLLAFLFGRLWWIRRRSAFPRATGGS